MSQTSEKAVIAEELVKKYGQFTAVDRVSFAVNQGETFGLLGPIGAGKSTIMRMIYCRIPLTSGTLQVTGLDVATNPREIKARVGVVPQENNLDPDLSVIQNMLVYARYFRIPRAKALERAAELLEFAELLEKRSSRIEQISGGMKRKLMIARALLNDPVLLVLDEPTIGLDPHVRNSLWDRLRELRDKGMTILISTHNMTEAEKLCDRLLLLDHGRILVSGSPQKLIAEHALHFTLEVRGANGAGVAPVQSDSLVVQHHGATQYYFARSPELLSPLLQTYSGCETHLRPSNLEDVFLRLTGGTSLSKNEE